MESIMLSVIIMPSGVVLKKGKYLLSLSQRKFYYSWMGAEFKNILHALHA